MTEQMFGYNGQIAYIDLTTKTVKVEQLSPQIAEEYIGGTGLSAKLIYDLLDENDYKLLKGDAFHPKNPLIFSTGPITGTARPSSGRYSVSGISPLTNIWGEGTSGGFFCLSLRKSGFDAIVITGKSDKPCYILINDGNISFKDAMDLWGLDTYETQERIKSHLALDGVRVTCIGPAGERLVRYAAIINDDGRAQGRCGLGAVMGSKKLKAIAIHGKKQIPLYNNKKMKELRKDVERKLETDLVSSILPKLHYYYGTNMYMDMGMFAGDVPAYYFTETEFPAELLTEKTIKEHYPVLTSGCVGCTLKCAKHTILKNGENEIRVDGPEFETFAAYGPLCGNFSRESIIKAGHLANKYGLDTISSGVCIAFLIYLVENNISTKSIKPSLKSININHIHWGNNELIVSLIEKIALREGIGDILAEGVKRMAEKWNVDPELAAHVKGLEIPMHDPRAYAGQALTYMTACIGASHEKSDWFQTEIGGFQAPEFGIISGAPDDISGREQGVMHLQDLRGIDDSAVNCNFSQPPKVYDIAKYLSYATGFQYTPFKLMKTGERIFNIKREISCNLGITRKDDYLPKHVLKALSSGKTKGINLELEENLKEYYKARGWEWGTGRPSEEKLLELGIIGGKQEEAIIKTEVSEEEKKEIEKLREIFVPKLKAKTITLGEIPSYLEFIVRLANSEEGFYYEFEVAEERFLFASRDLPREEWYWIKIDNGKFYTGRGEIANPTFTLEYKNRNYLQAFFNMDIDIRAAVLTGKIKAKPLGKAKIIINFFALYLDIIDLAMNI